MLLEINPQNPNSHNNIGNAYANKYFFDSALKEYNMAISIKPNYNIAYSSARNNISIFWMITESQLDKNNENIIFSKS